MAGKADSGFSPGGSGPLSGRGQSRQGPFWTARQPLETWGNFRLAHEPCHEPGPGRAGSGYWDGLDGLEV
jgi:hypothetical protein